jgi:hypothetical protein
LERDEVWSASLATGSQDLVAGVQSELGISAAHRAAFAQDRGSLDPNPA